MNTTTKKGTARQPATVNRELTLLSSAFSLAVKYDKADFNPCSKVGLFPLDNLRYRYLLPEEEPLFMAELTGPRAHLKAAVIVALGTGCKTLAELCKDKRSDDYVFVSPKDSDKRQREVKKGFHTAGDYL